MSKVSAGLLMYKIENDQIIFFLVHPGGPFFKNKDEGWWTIPKGVAEDGEELLETAKREFEEETGMRASGPFIALDYVIQKGGKKVYAWAFEGSCDDPSSITCNTFQMEWPPKSGKYKVFKEVDIAEWMDLPTALAKLNKEQALFLYRLVEKLELK